MKDPGRQQDFHRRLFTCPDRVLLFSHRYRVKIIPEKKIFSDTEYPFSDRIAGGKNRYLFMYMRVGGDLILRRYLMVSAPVRYSQPSGRK